MKQNEMILKYDSPAPYIGDFVRSAPLSNEPRCSWERYSLPLGNGRFGANVFGRTEQERIQISEPSLCNPYYKAKNKKHRGNAGVNSFAELLFDINHPFAEDYIRTLSLDTGCAEVSYKHRGVRYKRTAFVSYPDNVLVMRFEADKPASVTLTLRAVIPFLGEYTVEDGDGFSKTGEVSVSGDEITLLGEMGYYGIKYEGIIKLIPDGGRLAQLDDGMIVENTDALTVIFTCSTNYKLSEQAFTEPRHEMKLAGFPHPHEAVRASIDAAAKLSYAELLDRHIADYTALYGRVTLTFNEQTPDLTTDALLDAYKRGERSRYLEILMFQYGRYLLISSSRDRLPAHLQGIWNPYCNSPWSAGYWHNINIQMNYWLSGPANLSELFIPYINYAKAYMPAARRNADEFVELNYPERLSPSGENGWILGTGGWPYMIEGVTRIGHSGPGTGAFTSLLFWDYYEYTGDLDFLREFGYPALREMSLFFSKILVDKDGACLVRESASPEVIHQGKYYKTVGCAFDQQMVYENDLCTIKAAAALGIEDDELIREIKARMPRLDHVLIGEDGQVKEYREETTYCSIGDEPNHRHISHLVSLYPGVSINSGTPEWMKAAKTTLRLRGDGTTGWSTAHRLLMWARTGSAEMAMKTLGDIISRCTMENLWDCHPPFQIDGNFGYTAGVCEMLLSSNSDCIELLPALPAEWQSGEFTGLVARGAFEIDCRFEGGVPTAVTVRAKKDGTLRIKLPTALIPAGAAVDNGVCTVEMQKGSVCVFSE